MQELLTSYADPAAGQGQVMRLDEDQHDQIHMLLQAMEMIPRCSKRKQLLRHVQDVLVTREASALLRDVLSDEDSDEDDLDEFWEHKYEHIQGIRYATRPSYYQKRKITGTSYFTITSTRLTRTS
ncbi:hypothetical protein L917_17168 [Phytophthora nicotianae]|uniref:Uncharacterized protein n=1 Tax=Phytophthora nicotianae TaxID=4792 RepID=W2KBX2_PHYNI|nr:hypothetical protein L917_17168 [Phytophthora nicotianae]